MKSTQNLCVKKIFSCSTNEKQKAHKMLKKELLGILTRPILIAKDSLMCYSEIGFFSITFSKTK